MSAKDFVQKLVEKHKRLDWNENDIEIRYIHGREVRRYYYRWRMAVR